MPNSQHPSRLSQRQRTAIALATQRLSYSARDCGHKAHTPDCPFCSDVEAYRRLVAAFPGGGSGRSLSFMSTDPVDEDFIRRMSAATLLDTQHAIEQQIDDLRADVVRLNDWLSAMYIEEGRRGNR